MKTSVLDINYMIIMQRRKKYSRQQYELSQVGLCSGTPLQHVATDASITLLPQQQECEYSFGLITPSQQSSDFSS
jgi:hypothetical protein